MDSPAFGGHLGAMVFSVLAIAILCGSTLLILANLRMVLRDIFDVVRHSVTYHPFTNNLAANVALVALWLLLFFLSFG